MELIKLFHHSIHISAREKEYQFLFEELYDRLLYFSIQIIRDQEQAEDLVQDAFAQLWLHFDELKSERKVYKAYLYQTVKNLSINYKRHLQVRAKYDATLVEEPEDSSLMESIIAAEVVAAMRSAIDTLPDHFKTISELSFYEGKKNQEIADELQISVNTIKKQKQKAIQLLRVKLSSLFINVMILFSSLG